MTTEYRVLVNTAEEVKKIHPELFEADHEFPEEEDVYFNEVHEQRWIDYIPDVIILVYENDAIIISMSYPGNASKLEWMSTDTVEETTPA